jgi:hypothetical protein
MYVLFWAKRGLGYILGDFSQTHLVAQFVRTQFDLTHARRDFVGEMEANRGLDLSESGLPDFHTKNPILGISLD